ncbi:6-phosphofructokinase, partial [Jimgerdemannia flammicorona]
MPIVEGLSHFTLTAPNPDTYTNALVFYSALGFQTVAAPSGDTKEVWLTLFGKQPIQDLTVKLWINPSMRIKDPLPEDSEWRLEQSNVAAVSGDLATVESILVSLSRPFQKHTPAPSSNPLSVPLTASQTPTELYALDPLNNLLTFTNVGHPLSCEVVDRTTKPVAAPSSIPSGHSARRKKIGVLTSGGDSPGMNASVRAIVRVGIARGCDVYGIYEGYRGLVEGKEKIKKLKWDDVRGFIHIGGTVIGTARCMEFKERPGRLQAAENLIKNGIDALIVCGGDGSLTGADLFRSEWSGLLAELVSLGRCSAEEIEPYRALTIVGLVGSIDNDMSSTDITIGAVTSLHRICESVDSISSTAMSHQRAFVIEVMGRHCGWLALMAGISCGADLVFIPERPPVEEDWETSMCDLLQSHRLLGKRKTIVIVAEGAIDQHLKPIKPDYIKDVLSSRLGLDTRVTTLGHVQRGGAPAAFDRYLSTIQGVEAVEAVFRSTPELPSPMIGMCQNQVTWQPLVKAVEMTHAVAKAIKEKDFKRAMELRDPEFAEEYVAFLQSTIVDDESIKVLPHQRLRIGIIHLGAPAGGMNTATRVAVRYAINRGHTPLAIYNGFPGLIRGAVEPLGWLSVDGWTTRGGSELGTNRSQPDMDMGMVTYQLQKHNIQGLFLIGGFEAYTAMLSLEAARGAYPALNIPLVHLPATISNNVPGTDFSLGSDTSLNAIVEACDTIVQSASASRRRVFVIEVQGGKTGYLAVMAGLATGATTVYIPEIGIML